MELKIFLILMFIKVYFYLLNLMLNFFFIVFCVFVRVKFDLEEEVFDVVVILGIVLVKLEDGREG